MSLDVLEGSIETIIFHNPENGYSVFDMVCGMELITVTGYFPVLYEGDSLRIKGKWTSHPDYGEQFSAETYEFIPPASLEAVEKYIASGVFPGVGKMTASRIVDMFGDESLKVIRDEPEKLAQIKGITLQKALQISEIYQEKYVLGNISIFLQQFGIGTNLAYKIFKLYGENTIEVIKDNSYRLIDEVQGIGFRAADQIALKMGLPRDSKERIASGLKYVLSQATQSGHVYLPVDILIKNGAALLGVDDSSLKDILADMEIRGIIRQVERNGTKNIYLVSMYLCETYIAKRLVELSMENAGPLIEDADKRIRVYEKHENIVLAENQIKAIKESLSNGVLVITGGPGTGKTTIIKGIISMYIDEGYKVAIAAPTGRAAKRISEATGYEAKTIHRLLEPNYVIDVEEPRFSRNSENPLEADIVIIDEISMVDVHIMYHLLKALEDGTRLILAGDADQLPSVGPGKILKCIIESGVITTVKLHEIFRQADSSYIVHNAHKINQGEMPVVNEKMSDFYFMLSDKPSEVVNIIAELCSKRLPLAYGYDSIRDIQVLTPTRRGQTGVEDINIKLQEYLNPSVRTRKELKFRNLNFRVGDKVMQIKNNYTLRWENKYDASIEGTGVFNGDMGIITDINKELRYMDVEFDDDRIVRYDHLIYDQLEHAYAITIHKSQGSEFDAVIIPLCPGPPILYTRNLIYTAVTRAKKLVILVGNPYILEKMINNTNEQMRYTDLAEFLKNAAEREL